MARGAATRAPAKTRAPTKAELEKRKLAYNRGLHDGQMAAFAMMAFVAHPEILSELLEGRAQALARALRALGGHPDEQSCRDPPSPKT